MHKWLRRQVRDYILGDLPDPRRFVKQVDSAYLLSVRNHAHSITPTGIQTSLPLSVCKFTIIFKTSKLHMEQVNPAGDGHCCAQQDRCTFLRAGMVV